MHHRVPSAHLFVVPQGVGGGEADGPGLELRGLVAVVQLDAGPGHLGLQHLHLPVVHRYLQVKEGGLQAGVQHRRRVDWGEMHRYRIKYDEVTKTYHMKGILMHAKHT